MKPYEQATNSMSMDYRLDQIHMSPDGRRSARASMRQAEMIADMVLRAHEDLRRLFGSVRRGISALARHSKGSPATPEWRLP
jgi:hypothetical protein